MMSGERMSGGESYRRRGSLWWLAGDGKALVAAQRRENATGENEGRMAGGERPGYI
jgi:hypothetical protein